MLDPRSATGPGGSSAGHRRDVVDGAAVQRAAGVAVAALVEGHAPRGPAARPPGRSRNGSPWQEPAPCRITTPPAARSRAATARRRGPPLAGSTGVGPSGCVRIRRPHGRGQQLSHVYPLGSRVNEAGHLEIGGCDAVELAREFGTPAYVVAEDDLRARARAFVEALRGARTTTSRCVFASKAFPCTAVLRRVRARRAWAATSPRAASCTSRCAAGFDPARDLPARQRQGRRRAARGARGGRRPRGGRQPSTRSSACERLARRPRQRGAGPRRPRASSPTPTTASPPASSTRSSASASTTRARRSSACAAPSARPGGPAHAHRVPDLRARVLPRARVEALAGARRLPGLRPRRRAGRRLHAADDPPAIEEYVEAMVGAVARAARRRPAAGRSSRGARWSPTRA